MHVDVNAIEPLVLFQATLPLLRKAAHGSSEFVTVSSAGGLVLAVWSSGLSPVAAYGASKAVVNYLTRKNHFEHEDLIAYAMDLGLLSSPSFLPLSQTFWRPYISVAS